MSRAVWLRHTAAAGVMAGAGTALAATGGDPVLAGIGGGAGALWLVRQAARAAREPGLELFRPALCRGRHPGRVGLMFRGVPRRGVVPFGATCFVGTRDEAAAVGALGLEPALFAADGRAAAALGVPVRWLDVPWVHPFLHTAGLTLVAPAHHAADHAGLDALGAGVFGTDLVRLPPLDPDRLDTLLRAWDARGIRAASLSEVVEVEGAPGADQGRIQTGVPGSARA